MGTRLKAPQEYLDARGRRCALSYRRFRLYKAVRIIPRRSVSVFYSLCFDNSAKRPYPLMGEKKKETS